MGLVADRGRRCRAGAGDRVGAARAGSGLARPTWFINLTGADLTNMDLHGALLWDARLAGTIFDGANLAGADLDGAHLTNAHLTGANLVLPPRVAAEAFQVLPFVSRVVERRMASALWGEAIRGACLLPGVSGRCCAGWWLGSGTSR